MVSVGDPKIGAVDPDGPSGANDNTAILTIAARKAELAHLGLVVDEHARSGCFHFKVVDRRNDEVLLELTREQFFRLSARQLWEY